MDSSHPTPRTEAVVTPEAERVRAFAPATVSNLGAGFDVFGLAVSGPGDEVVVTRAEGRGVVSVSVAGDDGRLPTDPAKNAASAAAQAVLDELSLSAGLAVHVDKGLPLSAGLGGSAASAVAGAVAANALLEGGLSEEALLRCARAGEEKGSGAAHLDNAAPALVGGFVIIPAGEPLRIVRVPTPEELTMAVVHPHVEVETANARAALGDTVSLSAGITQWGNSAALIAGLYQRDWDLIGSSLVDAVAEPIRREFVPGFEAVRRAAMSAGAVGMGLSGSGPSVFAMCRGRATAEAAAAAMVDAFRAVGGVESDVLVSAVAADGARILERDQAG